MGNLLDSKTRITNRDVGVNPSAFTHNLTLDKDLNHLYYDGISIINEFYKEASHDTRGKVACTFQSR